jgi:hypothetical protein
MLEIKLSFETCDRWGTEQRILAVYPYSIKRTSPIGVDKNKDTRIRKILLHLQQQAYGREFSGFHSCVFYVYVLGYCTASPVSDYSQKYIGLILNGRNVQENWQFVAFRSLQLRPLCRLETSGTK